MTSPDTWTTRRLLEWMTGHFESKAVDTPRVVAEMLLSHVLDCERMRLYMEVDRPADPRELAALRDLVTRASRHEPVQYLVGHAWFFSRKFTVTPAVLIPRPSTETLCEHVVQWCRASDVKTPRIADVGTGSGCIAISLAAQMPGATVVATDPSVEALKIARANAAGHGVSDRIEFIEGSGLAPLQGRFDVLASNPPYISDAEWADVPPNVRDHEPETALRGGVEGLDVIRPIIEGVAGVLRPGGCVAVEIADSQRDAALTLARDLADVAVLKDHEDLWRVLVATRPRS